MKTLCRSCLALFLVVCALGCKETSGRGSSSPAASGPVLDYLIPGIFGDVLDSAQHRGRVTVLLFVTTFDIYSQAQATRLEDLFRSHEPRINAAAIVMEPPKNIELVQTFASVLGLTYSVGIADRPQLQSQGLLGAVKTVPAWIVLDAQGRVTVAGVGPATLTELEQAVTLAEQ